jgi:hypothetical protein
VGVWVCGTAEGLNKSGTEHNSLTFGFHKTLGGFLTIAATVRFTGAIWFPGINYQIKEVSVSICQFVLIDS